MLRTSNLIKYIRQERINKDKILKYCQIQEDVK